MSDNVPSRAEVASWRIHAFANPIDYGGIDPRHLAPYRRDTFGLTDRDARIQALLTVDEGMWSMSGVYIPADSTPFSNSDYERCLHLSIVEREPPSRLRINPAGDLRAVSEAERRAWEELVFTKAERRQLARARERGPVLHLRVFLDEHDQVIRPRREVYDYAPASAPEVRA